MGRFSVEAKSSGYPTPDEHLVKVTIAGYTLIIDAPSPERARAIAMDIARELGIAAEPRTGSW